MNSRGSSARRSPRRGTPRSAVQQLAGRTRALPFAGRAPWLSRPPRRAGRRGAAAPPGVPPAPRRRKSSPGSWDTPPCAVKRWHVRQRWDGNIVPISAVARTPGRLHRPRRVRTAAPGSWLNVDFRCRLAGDDHRVTGGQLIRSATGCSPTGFANLDVLDPRSTHRRWASPATIGSSSSVRWRSPGRRAG